LPVKVFIISGAAASGKSSYAKTLRKRENFTILDLDDRLNELIEKDPAHVEKIGMEAFLKEIREFRYNDLRERGVALVDQGKSVALVAPFTQHIRDVEQWNWLTQPFVARGITPELHWVYVEPEEQMKRLVARKAKRDVEKVANAANLESFVASKPTSEPVIPHVKVDGSPAS
jgi:dephospho-CoA kinase